MKPNHPNTNAHILLQLKLARQPGYKMNPKQTNLFVTIVNSSRPHKQQYVFTRPRDELVEQLVCLTRSSEGKK